MNSALRLLTLSPQRRIALALVVAALPTVGLAATPQRILTLHSFSRDFSPYSTMVTTFRSELERNAQGPLAFYEAALDAGQAGPQEDTRPMIAFLRARFAQRAPDLVVCIEVPAAQFYLQNRETLFRDTPVLVVGSEVRLTQQLPLRATDAAVGSRVDIPRLAENILTVLPDTKTIAVVIGATQLERFWAKEAQR